MTYRDDTDGLRAYIDFCLQHGAFYDAIASLDDIRGDVAKSRANHTRLAHKGWTLP